MNSLFYRVVELSDGIGGRSIWTFSTEDEAGWFGKELNCDFRIEIIDLAGKVVK